MITDDGRQEEDAVYDAADAAGAGDAAVGQDVCYQLLNGALAEQAYAHEFDQRENIRNGPLAHFLCYRDCADWRNRPAYRRHDWKRT
jgi:hypothetical protein